MNKKTTFGRIATLLLAVFMSVSVPAMAVSDGNYNGNFHGKSVTAVLETMSTTVTGLVTIGEQQYLFKAEEKGGRLDGELTSMSGDRNLPVSMTLRGAALQVLVGGGEEMNFTLWRQ